MDVNFQSENTHTHTHTQTSQQGVAAIIALTMH